jgi:hypothetical protein
VVLASGVCVGGLSELELLVLFELAVARLCEAVALFALTVLPGNALAATSENTAVSASEPATIQRLARLSRRNAASRADVCRRDIANGPRGKSRSATSLRSGG